MTTAFQRNAFQDNAFQIGPAAHQAHGGGAAGHRGVTGGKGPRDKEELERLEAAIRAAFEKVEGKTEAIEIVQASPAASVTEAQTITFPDLRPEIEEAGRRLMQARALLDQLERLIEQEEDDEEVLLLT